MPIGNDKSPIAVAMYDGTGAQLTVFPVSGTLSVSNPVNAVTVSGTVSVANPVSTVTVANPVTTVTVSNPVNSVVVSGTVTNVQASQYVQTAGFTQIATNGTTTIKSGPGVFFGINPITLGTTASVSAFDGTVALLGTNVLSIINSLINPAPQGVGIRFNTSLVVVTAGITPPLVNALWD